MYRRIIHKFRYRTTASMSTNTTFTPRTVNAIHIPLCKNCIHFKPYPNPGSVQLTPNYNAEHFLQIGTCDLFGEFNMVTGSIRKEYASVARISNDMCGHQAHYYQEHHHKNKHKQEKEQQHEYRNKKYDDSILS